MTLRLISRIAHMPVRSLGRYAESEQRAVVRQVAPGSGVTGIRTRFWVVVYPGGYRFTGTFDSAINFANDKIKELRSISIPRQRRQPQQADSWSSQRKTPAADPWATYGLEAPF